MHQKFTSLLIIILMSVSWSFAQTTVFKTIVHDGQTREYDVFLPAAYSAGVQMPMVFNLHGIGSNVFEQKFYTNFNSVANAEGFIVVIPQGLTDTVGSGDVTPHWNSYFGSDVDDVGFLNLLIDAVYTDYDIDLARVYSTGFSNGGFMSYRLACELSDRITAIASVSGSVVLTQFTNCTPSRGVPVMQIHGTEDEVVLYDGTPGFSPPIPDLVDYWVGLNNCDATPTVIDVPNNSTTDNSTVQIEKYLNGDGGSEVWFYIVDNGGHTWPDGAIDLPGQVTNHDFNASEDIWEFFNQFTHPNPAAGTLLMTANENLMVENIEVLAFAQRKELLVKSDTEDIEEVKLYNLSGQVIHQVNFNQPQSQVSLDALQVTTGIYVASVRTTAGVFTKKVLF